MLPRVFRTKGHRLVSACCVLLTLGATVLRQATAQDISIPKELPQVASAYAAKITAAAIFGAGRTLASVQQNELAPDAPLQAMIRPLLRIDVDRESASITARVLSGAATASWIEGIGAVVGSEDEIRRLRGLARPRPQRPRDPRPWPYGDAIEGASLEGIDHARLDQAVAAAFVETEGKPLIRTRAVVVVHKGRLLRERYADGFDATSVLAGWSMTKSWTDAMLGAAVHQGLFDDQAPLPIPAWQEPDDPRRALRADDLLRMHSGLEWLEDYDAPGSDAVRMLFGTTDAAGLAATAPLSAGVGQPFLYSSGSTNLLQKALRETVADDRAYLDLPRALLFDPLGMLSARIECDGNGTLVGSSFGYATARDWAKVGLLYLNGGVWQGKRILPEGWVAAACRPAASAPRGNYGRHWWLNAGRDGARPLQRLPADLFYMSGYEGQYVLCLPEQDLVLVRLGCTKRGGFDLQTLAAEVVAACGG
jgi:CubicO group peptidase (beta-lactamase class C family)